MHPCRLCRKLMHTRWCNRAIDLLIDTVNGVTRFLGKIFFVTVLAAVTFIIFSFYYCLVPYFIQFSTKFSLILHLIFSHYLLLNIIFHYCKAVFTNPGKVTNAAKVDAEQVRYFRAKGTYRICKHCNQVKPPRTYHCSVCNSCILKMEHHCPWINNCVGWLNHKFYLLFMWFLWIGCFYYTITAFPLFKAQHRYFEDNQTLRQWMENVRSDGETFRSILIFSWVICFAVILALGVLVIWQSWLVSFGETSVERLKSSYNRKQCKKQGRVYTSVHDCGFKENWKKMLGFRNRREFFTKVLLPSSDIGDEARTQAVYILKPADLL